MLASKEDSVRPPEPVMVGKSSLDIPWAAASKVLRE